jgi:heme-degrading monooxygenase HmoA
MFARMLELTLKPEKKLELIRKMKDDILPLLNKYHGFVDVLALEVENEPTKFIAISLWNNRTEIEKYEKELYPKVKTILDPLLATAPMVKFCKLDPTMTQKVLTVAA